MSNGEMWDSLCKRLADMKHDLVVAEITRNEELNEMRAMLQDTRKAQLNMDELLGKVIDTAQDALKGAKDALGLASLALWTASASEIQQGTGHDARIDSVVERLKQFPVSPELAPIFESYLSLTEKRIKTEKKRKTKTSRKART